MALDAQGQILGIGITDGTGTYELNAVASGTVTVVADRDGYAAAQIPVAIPQNVYTIENVNITMSPSSPTSAGDPGAVPQAFALGQNYPNPFNPSTSMTYSLSAPSMVTLTVYNMLGQEIATLVNEGRAAGTHDILWNGTDMHGRSVASGVYMYRLRAVAGSTEFTQVRKMLLMK
jgi:hypothetical protein